MKILVTGGAGFVGTVLVPMLLERGHSVHVVDSLVYESGSCLLPFFQHRQFEFTKGDVRSPDVVKTALADADVIIHLAAIVGYPACKKDERLAREVNVGATLLINGARSADQPLLFASTGSNYGEVEGICTEETPLNPLTAYGVTKTEAEQAVMQTRNVVAYRFATAFGVSPRMRLDLLINDFAYQAVVQRNLIVYEADFKRTFIHSRDIAYSWIFAIDHLDRMVDNVYNIGSDKMNLSKRDVALMLKDRLDFYLHFAQIGSDPDQRNYVVSYEKVQRVGFDTTVTIEEGIDELIRCFAVIDTRHPFSNV